MNGSAVLSGDEEVKQARRSGSATGRRETWPDFFDAGVLYFDLLRRPDRLFNKHFSRGWLRSTIPTWPALPIPN
jgi:hypothetical protein